MKRQLLLWVLAMFAGMLFAQQSKLFTLDELIPGGKDFHRFSPRMEQQFQWNGDKLIITKGDSVFVAAKPEKFENKELLFTLNDLSTDDQRASQATFSQEGSPVVRLRTAKGIALHDLENRSTISFDFPPNSENHSLAPNNKLLAFTTGNNLHIVDENGVETEITREENKGIVHGTSVHRDEFGISKGIFWSPNGKKLAFYRMDETMVEDYPLVDASAREAKLKAIKYPMAGMVSHEVTVGIYDTETGSTIYLKTGEPEDHYLTNIAWNPASTAIYIAELNRGQNHMQLNRYDVGSGELEATLFEERHPKYVEPENPVLFVKNNPGQFIWQSKRDGFNHLYLYDISGKLIKQLTSGAWETANIIGFDAEGKNLYFTSTNPTPMDRHIWSVNLKNGKLMRHSTQPGMHSAMLSASGRYLIDRYAANDNPGKTDLIETKNSRSYSLAFASNPFSDYAVPTVETGILKAADGITNLHYRMVKPANFDENKKHPVVIYVYGGPHSQMVQNRWRYGSGGWEFHMAQKGHIVFVVDNRGTAYRGFDFENVTHRQLGVEEVKDQMKGVEFLQSLPYIDNNRMGVHGWSYGGFMTINMLLRHPDVFKVGVAGGPVTDWKYYEVMYGERYMDTPQENPEGYQETSLLNKADKLQSRLLIIHGDEDPVVVMQHSLQFLKSAIKAGTHPDFFIYTGHGHNMLGADRVHLHEHITRYFDDFCK